MAIWFAPALVVFNEHAAGRRAQGQLQRLPEEHPGFSGLSA
jgi:hypothetical protein